MAKENENLDEEELKEEEDAQEEDKETKDESEEEEEDDSEESDDESDDEEEDESDDDEDDDEEEMSPEDKKEFLKWKAKKDKRRSFAKKAEAKQNFKPQAYDDKRLERIELGQDGYSKDEVDAIMKLGGAKMVKNPLVKAAIEKLREKKKSKDASSEHRSKSPVYKKYTQADLDKMSSAELAKILPHDE